MKYVHCVQHELNLLPAVYVAAFGPQFAFEVPPLLACSCKEA